MEQSYYIFRTSRISPFRHREGFSPIPHYEECRSYGRAGSTGRRSPDGALIQSPPVVHRTVVRAFAAGYNQVIGN